MTKKFAQYLTTLITNDVENKMPEDSMGISSYECEKVEAALMADKFNDVEKWVDGNTKRSSSKSKNMSKIQFDPTLRTFSYNGAVVEGKAHIVYKDGKVVDGGGRVTFDPKGIVSIESRGSVRFGSMQCKEARFLGSAVFDKVKCDKFHSGGSLSCESIVADTVSINGGTDEHGYGSNTIGSITASVATIGGSDSSFIGKILKGVNGGSTFHIKTLDCDTAYLDGDVTIGVMRCSGICKVKGDKVKILKEEK